MNKIKRNINIYSFINKIRILGILAILMLLLSPAAVSAQTPLTQKESKKKVKGIASAYPDWKTAEWQGKVRSEMLPVSITAKVFLKKDQLVMVSLRAPLIGEVARVEVDPQSVLVVNKMKRRYWKKDIAAIDSKMPGSFECLQSLLLGRAFIIGQGELSEKTGENAAYYGLGDEYTFIAPMIPVEIEDFSYGFAVDNAGRLVNIIMQYAETAEDGSSYDPASGYTEDSSAQESAIESLNAGKIVKYDFSAEITPKGKGADAKAVLTAPGMNYSLTVDGGEIQWGGDGYARININSNYQSTSLSQCLRF